MGNGGMSDTSLRSLPVFGEPSEGGSQVAPGQGAEGGVTHEVLNTTTVVILPV